MKILKKLLLVGLCSFCFFVAVNADTQEWTKLIDTSSKDEFLENYKVLLDNIEYYIKDNIEEIEGYNSKINLSNDEMIIFYNQDDLGTNSIRVYFIDNSRNFIIRTSGSSNIAYDIYFIVFIFNFDENYNILSVEPRNNAQLMTGSYSVLNNLIFDWRFGKNSNLLINNSTDYNIVLNNKNDIFFSKTTISAYEYVSLLNYYLLNNEENVCDKTLVLGTVSNVSQITLNVKGETSALAEPLKGTFTLNYSDYSNILTSDNFNIEIIDNDNVGIVGNYTFKCAEDSYNCYLNYEYNTSDDIIETASISFKITPKNNEFTNLFVKIYSCSLNNNYTGISYDYTDLPSDSTTSNPSLDNYLNDLTPPNSDISSLGNIQGILPEGPVDGLLNIPFKVISILIDGFNGTCKPISFNFVFDMPLTFPCVGDELYYHMDSTLMLFVNIVPTAFILIRWFKNLYVRVQRATSLETTTDDEWGGI